MSLCCAHTSCASAEPSNATAIIRISSRLRQAWPVAMRGCDRAGSSAQQPFANGSEQHTPYASVMRGANDDQVSVRGHCRLRNPRDGAVEASKRRSTWPIPEFRTAHQQPPSGPMRPDRVRRCGPSVDRSAGQHARSTARRRRSPAAARRYTPAPDRRRAPWRPRPARSARKRPAAAERPGHLALGSDIQAAGSRRKSLLPALREFVDEDMRLPILVDG